jgi:hypothetical protein
MKLAIAARANKDATFSVKETSRPSKKNFIVHQ